MPVLFSFFCLVPSPLIFDCQRPFAMAPIGEAQEQLGRPRVTRESHQTFKSERAFGFSGGGEEKDNSRGVFSK